MALSLNLDTNNVQQLEKKIYIEHALKRDKFKNERKKLLCCKMYELVTCCGGDAFFQYTDDTYRTCSYATSDAVFEKYLTTGICPGSSDSWLDNTGTVLNHITYIKGGNSKLQVHTKPNTLTHKSNRNALSYVDRKRSSFSYVPGDTISLPETPVVHAPTNVSSSAASEIVSSSSTSMTFLLPSTALSSIHLTNAERILGKTSVPSTVAYSPPTPAAPPYVQPILNSVNQTVTFPAPVNPSMMFIPQSHIQNTGVKTQAFAMPAGGHTILMPIQGRPVSLLSPINKTILMPFSQLEKSLPITYHDLTGQRKVKVSQTKNKTQQEKIVKPKENSDPHLPVFNMLVSSSSGTPASASKILYTGASAAKQTDKSLPKNNVVTPPESPAICDSLEASSPATSAVQKKHTDMDVDPLVSSSIETRSTSSNMDCSATSQEANNKNSEKPVSAKSETITTDKLFVEKSECPNKASPCIQSADIPVQSSPNILDSGNVNNSCNQTYKDKTNNVNDSIDSKLIIDEKPLSLDVKTAPSKASDSEESSSEMDDDDDDDSSEDNEDSVSSTEEEAHCEVCGELYNNRRDNKRMGRWIGCEKDCGVWVHRKCVGWTEEMVDTQSYYCDKCQLERLCRLDESL